LASCAWGRHLEAQLGILLGLFDLLAGQLAGGHRVLALDALGHVFVGDAFHFQRMQAAEIGDLLEGERGVVDQPDGGRLGHQRFFGHGTSFPGRAFGPHAALGLKPFEDSGGPFTGRPAKEKGLARAEQNLSDMGALAIRAWAAWASASGKTLSTTGLMRPAAIRRPDLAHKRIADRAFFRVRAAPQRGRHEGQPLHQHQPEIDLRGHAALEGDVHESALPRASARKLRSI
jgi:hypothetical protein